MNAKDFKSKSANVFTKEWCKQFNHLLRCAKCEQGRLNAKLSRLDKKRQECLHFLELESPNAATRAKVTALLVTISKDRREVKEKLNDVNAILSRMGTKELDETVEKSYDYSEEFLTEILGDGDE